MLDQEIQFSSSGLLNRLVVLSVSSSFHSRLFLLFLAAVSTHVYKPTGPAMPLPLVTGVDDWGVLEPEMELPFLFKLRVRGKATSSSPSSSSLGQIIRLCNQDVM